MLISVCIPTYNGEKYLKEQLESILVQLGEYDEIIISDDSSTDNTIKIIESFKDKRIKLLKNNKFKSPIYNLENALKNASGKYIFLSDQDDIWKSNKVRKVLPLLLKYNLIVSDCELIDENGNLIGSSFFKTYNSKKGLFNNIIKNSYLGCCMTFDRNILNSALPFPKKIAMHDIWIGLISEVVGKPFFLNEVLISYRRHGSNFSPTTGKSEFRLLYKINYRLQFLYSLLIRFFILKFK